MLPLPKTKLRNLQFDSFFIECVRNAPKSKQDNLTEAERYWCYQSDNTLHKFNERATLDAKQAILVKLGYHWAVTVFNERGCDKTVWLEQINAAKGVDSAKDFFDDYVHESNSFIIGSYEVRRILNRLDVMYNSKMFPISRYIKRMRDYKKLAQYEALNKEGDFIYFILKISMGFVKMGLGDKAAGLNHKTWMILVLLYTEHRHMKIQEIKEPMTDILPHYKVETSLKTLHKFGYIEKTQHPYSWGGTNKNYTYMISDDGATMIGKLCAKILQAL